MKTVGLPEETVVPHEDGVPVLVEEQEAPAAAPEQEGQPALI
jgi:hypothetical protein